MARPGRRYPRAERLRRSGLQHIQDSGRHDSVKETSRPRSSTTMSRRPGLYSVNYSSWLPTGILGSVCGIVAVDNYCSVARSVAESGPEFDEPLGKNLLFLAGGDVVDDLHGQRHDVGVEPGEIC
jgi:hypothetical protein